MLDVIKKNWLIVIAVIVLVLVTRFFWPEQAEQETPAPSPEPVKTVEPTRPKPAPEPADPKPQIATLQEPLPEVSEDDYEEEVYEEAEEEPQKRNFVLCEHIVSGESSYEFTGQIRLINKGGEPIYGWNVTWEYEDGSTIIEATGVALAGNNPYTGQYLPENAEIAPGKTVTFSFTGVKGGDFGPRGIEVKGNFCM